MFARMTRHDGETAYLEGVKYYFIEVDGKWYFINTENYYDDPNEAAVYKLIRKLDHEEILVSSVEKFSVLSKVVKAFGEECRQAAESYLGGETEFFSEGWGRTIANGKVVTSDVDRRTTEEVFAAIAEGRI